MKKLIALLMVLGAVARNVGAKCINPSHAKSKLEMVKGTMVETKKYICTVKRSDAGGVLDPFQPITRLCKTCGCHISDHDNT
jgi:hypothetical protein